MKSKVELDVNCLYINGLAIKSKEEWDLVVKDYYKIKRKNCEPKEQIDDLIKKYNNYKDTLLADLRTLREEGENNTSVYDIKLGEYNTLCTTLIDLSKLKRSDK